MLAVPVAARQSVELLRAEADEIVAVEEPEHLWAVGLSYEDFGQTPDAEVSSLLRRARGPRTHAPEPAGAADDSDPPLRRAVTIPIDQLGQPLQGDLVVPENATGLVVFAHGSGSSRHSPRNRHVAATRNRGGLATLLVDLLAPEEELDRRKVFDIALLARRLATVTRWSQGHPGLTRLEIGYFGASTGAAAALRATADADGRWTLSGSGIRRVKAP